MVMKAKKLLLVVVLTLALLAVALILPAAAMGVDDDERSSWVNGNCTINKLPDSLIGFTIDVQQLGDGTLEGFVLQKIMRTSNPAFADAPTVRKATVFSLASFPWSLLFGLDEKYLDNYSDFHKAGDPYTWPDDLQEPKLIADDPTSYDQANIADFVVALPTPFLPFDPWPHRYVVIDFGEPGRKDLVQIYGWGTDIPGVPPFYWKPQLFCLDDFYTENPEYVEGDPIPVFIGNFQVHVGDTDG